MRKGLRRTLLVLGAALVVGGLASEAAAQAGRCGDVNGDNNISSLDLSSLQAGVISPACQVNNCANLNAVGGVELGDQIVLSRYISGGGSPFNQARAEQNLLFRPCTTAPAPLQCNTPGTAKTGRVTVSETWPNCPNCFYIRGLVTYADNSTLTIQPGACVRAIVDPANPAVILITRGSKINANGALNPIVFTSDGTVPGANPPVNRAPGNWGGVVINGAAPENFAGEPGSEGFPPGGDAVYGGDNPNALSAVLRFVRIEFSGVIIGEANELNLLTMNSLGRLSTIDHVQVNRGLDDGFEWFGGTARQKFLVATGVGDDGFDWQIGYQGGSGANPPPTAAVQFGLVHHDAESVNFDPGPPSTGDPDAHGMEGDNNEFDHNAQLRSAPWFCNLTLVGPRGTGDITGLGSDGGRLRRGTGGRVENVLAENWVSDSFDCRDVPATSVSLEQVVRASNNGGDPSCANCPSCGNVSDQPASALTGPLTYPGDVPGYCTPAGVLSDNRYLPSALVGAPDECDAGDPFFDSAPYAGAFNTTTNWLTSDKPCCPAGNPLAVIGGQRCWISFDLN